MHKINFVAIKDSNYFADDNFDIKYRLHPWMAILTLCLRNIYTFRFNFSLYTPYLYSCPLCQIFNHHWFKFRGCCEELNTAQITNYIASLKLQNKLSSSPHLYFAMRETRKVKEDQCSLTVYKILDKTFP